MSNRVGFAWAVMLGAALSGTALFSDDAAAQQGCCMGGLATGANAWTDGNATSDQWPANPEPYSTIPANGFFLPLKAPPPPYWWTHGEIEFGARGFVNDPMRGGSIFGNTITGDYVFLDQRSLAKYYEYTRIAPGAFGGGHVAAGSSDGLYQVDLWANNIAYGDQSYLLTASKIGEHYFSVQWDQAPHLYSTSALTPYLGLGTSSLTLPFTKPIAVTADLIPFLYQTDIGIQRNTVSASYRWTPTVAWDFNANYSNTSRTGTQVAGITEFNGFRATEVPAPVNDTTHNFGADGEYVGISPWGQRFTFKAGYNGSVYTDNISSYSTQNPFFPTLGSCKPPTATEQGTSNCVSSMTSTWPSNTANSFSGTASADLPFQSRYVGTLSYTRMGQNSPFQPMTNNPLAAISPNGAPWNSVAALPALSLNGEITTLLSNNVLTTKITPELTSKLSYRYYDFNNGTPRIIFPCWIHYDGTGTSAATTPPCGAAFEETISSLSMGYVKQNAGAQLNWRPSSQWNLNVAYGFERYNYTQADANITNENSVKASIDWKPTVWLTARASGYLADRRYDTYDYVDFVRNIQFPIIPPFEPQGGSWFYSPAYRQFMFDNRRQTKADFAIDLVAFRGVTVSPTVKFKEDYYGLNPLYEEGLTDSRSISAGVDVAVVVNPDLSFTVSYYRENYNQLFYSNTSNQTPTVGQGLIINSDKAIVNTVTATMHWAAIPEKLDFDVRYAISDSVDQQDCSLCVATGSTVPAPFPDVTTVFQRLDATASYKFDRTVVAQMGFKDLIARLRYTWERNSVTNWQNDPIAPFTPAISTTDIWLASYNPNYNVQMLAASLKAIW